MALVDVGGYLKTGITHIFNAAPTFNTVLFTTTASGIYWVFQTPSTGYVKEFGIGISSMGQATTATISLQTVNTATGDASGTFWATGATGFFNIAVADSQTWKTVRLGTEILVHQGSFIALVIANTGNFSGSGNLSINISLAEGANPAWRYPYQGALPNTKTANKGVFGFTYTNSKSAYMNNCYPISSLQSSNISTNSQSGIAFSLPYPARVSGISFNADMDGDSNISLYSNDGSTVLTKMFVDKDIRGATTPGQGDVILESPVVLSSNTIYRMVITPLTTTSCNIPWFSINTENLMGMMSLGTSLYMTIAGLAPTSTASWTDFKTRVPFINLMIDQIDNGAGGGGNTINTYIQNAAFL